MAIIESGVAPTKLNIDPTSLAARVTLYDANGNEITYQKKATYSAENTFSPPGNESRITIAGSSTKIIEVISIVVGISNTAATSSEFIVRRGPGATITGGGITVGVPHDSNDPAPTATVTNTISASQITITQKPGYAFYVRYTPVAVTVQEPTTWGGVSQNSGHELLPRFRNKGNFNKPIILRGSDDLLWVSVDFLLNPNGTAVKFHYRIVWTEEDY